MNAAVQTLQGEFELKIKSFLVKLLKLGDDIDLRVDADLIDQIGLDSIEAFDAVATLHELLDVAIPDSFSPKVVNTIRSLAAYVHDTFGEDVVRRFIDLDLDRASVFADSDDL